MNILFFAGSLRADSCNKKLAREAMRLAIAAGAKGNFIDLKDYPMPPYDGDIQTATGIPETTKQLGAKIIAADALVISTPEYNGSIPGVLKNVIDWLSRDTPMPLTRKHVLLLGASPGALGGMRGLLHSRVPFDALGMHLFPDMMALPGAYGAFDESGKLKEEKPLQQLSKLIGEFIQHAGGAR